MSKLAQINIERPSSTCRRAQSATRESRLATSARAKRVRHLLDEAREACGIVGGGSYWGELALAIDVIAHIHSLVTDGSGERVTLRVPPMVGAFALNQAHHATHSIMIESVAAVRKFADHDPDLSAAAEE